MIVAEVVYINEEREDGFYDGIWITDTTTDELIDIVWVRSSDDPKPYDRAVARYNVARWL